MSPEQHDFIGKNSHQEKNDGNKKILIDILRLIILPLIIISIPILILVGFL